MHKPNCKVVNINPHEGQFHYLDRWVDKETFRAFVYDAKGNCKLASSYNEFESLIASGIWFALKPEASHGRKPKNDTVRPTSK